MKYYSASTNGFYDSDLHGSRPEDSVKISEELYQETMAAQEKGHQIVPDKNGRPTTEPREVPPKVTRDLALAGLVHDLGKGRVLQVRTQDRAIMRDHVERMGRTKTKTTIWRMADNSRSEVTAQELTAAIASGQDQEADIWQKFFDAE